MEQVDVTEAKKQKIAEQPQENNNAEVAANGDESPEVKEYTPSQEDIKLVVAACAGDISQVKDLTEKENADICFQVRHTLMH